MRDEDDCNHDNGNHNGFDHSEHNGCTGGDDDRGACIMVRSIDPKAVPVKIDWNSKAGNNFTSLPLNQPDWLPEFLGIPQPDRKTLAEITGLVVTVKE